MVRTDVKHCDLMADVIIVTKALDDAPEPFASIAFVAERLSPLPPAQIIILPLVRLGVGEVQLAAQPR